MANKPDVTRQKHDTTQAEGHEPPPDRPWLDHAAVEKLVRAAKKRGHVTHGHINLLSKELNSEQL